MTTKKAGRVLEHPPASTPVPSSWKNGAVPMIPQTTDKTCPNRTPWCDQHDAEQNLCIRSTGSFVLGATGGRRYNESRDDMPVTVSTRKYEDREPLVEVEIPETTQLGSDDMSVQWLTGPEARTLGLALTEAADTLAGLVCPPWCTVDHPAVGLETRSADNAVVLIHEAEFGMADLIQEQVLGRPLHEEMKIRLYVDQVSIVDAHTLIDNLNRAVCSAWGTR